MSIRFQWAHVGVLFLLLCGPSCALIEALPELACDTDEVCESGWMCSEELKRCVAQDSEYAAPWWRDTWRRRHVVRLIAGEEFDEPVELPVYIDLSAVELISKGGEDVVFVAEDAQGQAEVLPAELERWSSGRQAFFWVRFPGYRAGMKVWIYSGADGVTIPRQPVWSSQATGIYHFASRDVQGEDVLLLDQSGRDNHINLGDLSDAQFSDDQPGLGVAMKFDSVNATGKEISTFPQTIDSSPMMRSNAESLTVEISFSSERKYWGNPIESRIPELVTDEINCQGTQITLHGLSQDNGKIYVRHPRKGSDCDKTLVTQFTATTTTAVDRHPHQTIAMQIDGEQKNIAVFLPGRDAPIREPLLIPGDDVASVGAMYLGAKSTGAGGTYFVGWFDELIIHQRKIPEQIITLRADAMRSQGEVFSIGPAQDLSDASSSSSP